MEFIICNEKGEEITLLTDAQYIDMEIGDGNTFSIEISKEYQKRWGIDSGWRIGCPGKEYGGIIDKIVSTDNVLTISGATWRGLLTKKILQPPSGDDYLSVSGDADKIIDETICSQFDGIFVCNTTSGVEYSGFKFDRYVDSLAGIEKMLLSKNLRLNIEYDSGKANESSFVRIRSTPIHDFSDEIEYSKDGTLSYIYFAFEKFTGGINHLICLGKGELKDRLVLHLYADADGNISDKQSLFGKDERVTVYDYSNASSEDELREKGTERLKELLSYKSMDMDLFNESLAGLRGINDDISIGDIVGGRDFDTGIYLSKQITRKIVQVKNGKESIEYSVGKPVLNRTTANSPVEQSRSLTEKDVVDNLLSTATNLPLSANQGRILNEKSLLQNYRHYKWISDFGCTSYVFKDVLTAMPTQSVLICEAHDFCEPNGITITGYAMLRITKCTYWRILIEIIHHNVGVIAWTGNMTELDNIELNILSPITTAIVNFGELSVASKSWGNFNVLNKYTPPTGYTIISSNWHFGGTGYGACRFFPRGITSYDFVNDASSAAVISCNAYLVLQRTSI